MGRLIGERLLQAWERIRAYPDEEAVLAILALALPQHDGNELARLPLGERNAMLLDLRAASLGRRIEAFAVCPACGAQLEFALDCVELSGSLREQHASAPEPVAPHIVRPANTLDLLAARDARDEQEARSILLARTLMVPQAAVSAAQRDMAVSGAEWLNAQPDSEKAALVERFEQMNVAAEIHVQVDCAACHARPTLDLDIAHFFLRELAAAARRLMEDVHQLAGAYGWSERSIAKMSAARRAAYLEMVGA